MPFFPRTIVLHLSFESEVRTVRRLAEDALVLKPQAVALARSLARSHTRRAITYHFTLILLISHHAFLSSRVLASLILVSNYYKTRFSSSFRPFRNINETYSSSRYIKIKNSRCTRNQIQYSVCRRIIDYFASTLNPSSCRSFVIQLAPVYLTTFNNVSRAIEDLSASDYGAVIV